MREKRKISQISNTWRLRLWRTRDCQDARAFLFWAQRYSPLLARLCRNVTREVASFLSISSLLPGIYDGHLFVVNFYSQTVREIPFGKRNLANILLADDNTAICFTDCTKKWLVYCLDLLTLEIRELPTLQTFTMHRVHPCYLSQTIYAFWHSSSDSQKYSLIYKQWSRIPHTKIPDFVNILVPHISSIYIFLHFSKAYQTLTLLPISLATEQQSQRISSLITSLWVKSPDGKLLYLGKGNTL